MKSNLLTITAISLALSASLAIAQTSGNSGGTSGNSGSSDNSSSSDTTGSTTGSSGGEDASGYLSGPNIREFFTDNNGMTLRPANELKNTYGKMSSDDQAKLKSACASNKDAKYNELCSSVGSM